jgi:restriction system protein
MDTPQYYEFMNPTLQALREGGGTLTNEEIVDAVARIMRLPDEVMERQQAGHPNIREFEYRIAWAKSYLKQAGYLTQSTRGVWVLTAEGKAIDAVHEPTSVKDVLAEVGEEQNC